MLGKVESRETSKMFLDDARGRSIQVYRHLSHPSGRSGISQASGEYMGQEPAQKKDSYVYSYMKLLHLLGTEAIQPFQYR